MKSICSKTNLVAGLVILGLTQTAFAQDTSVPFVFSPGTTASADEVNANFIELEDAINRRPEMIASLAYSKTPTVRGVTLSNVTINGGTIIAPVAPGSKIDVNLNYHIVDPGCPGCIDQIQVGFSHQAPTTCVYSGVPGAGGASGKATFSITAPSEPGTYYLGSDRSQAFSCPGGWWNGRPSAANRWIGVITVK